MWSGQAEESQGRPLSLVRFVAKLLVVYSVTFRISLSDRIEVGRARGQALSPC